jgi:drug/metabolite transporter (DMT)-like permease
MMLIMPAFRDGVTGLVSALIAMNVLIILLYARIFLKEKFSRLELIGMTLALAGMAILKLTA